MDDAGAGAPEAGAVFGGGGAQEVIDFAVFGKRFAQVCRAFDARLYQMIAVDSGGDGDGIALRLHELQHARLPKHVLQDDAVGAGLEVANAGEHLLRFGIVKVAEQDFVRQGQRSVQAAAHDLDVALHRLIDFRRHFGGGFDCYHIAATLPSYKQARRLAW